MLNIRFYQSRVGSRASSYVATLSAALIAVAVISGDAMAQDASAEASVAGVVGGGSALEGKPRDGARSGRSASARAAKMASIDSGSPSQNLLITVRTIQAQGRIDENEMSGNPIPIRIDGRLKDLADKLRKLPFRGFVFMSGDERTVPVRRKEVLALVNGQTLSMRPLYLEDNKVGLWVRWQDRSGAEILDTRMHLDIGQSMIAGTDLLNDPSSGLVLAVEVAPQ
jgi:hypothetical protein